ncbi:MAG: hypothetical protein AAF705_02255 [Bacteroidota bacterium]
MKKYIFSIATIFCFPIFISAQTIGEIAKPIVEVSNSDNQTPEEIISQVKTVYRNLPYYVDSTVITYKTISTNHRHQSLVTLYSRPDYVEIVGESKFKHSRKYFRTGYHYSDEHNHALSWNRISFHPYDLEGDVVDLNMGLAKLGGTYGAAARSTVSLLIPDSISGNRPLDDFTRAYRQEDELVDGEACYVLDLYFPKDTLAAVEPVLDIIPAIPMAVFSWQCRYWIRKSDFMILRYDYELKKNEKGHEVSIRIYPQPERAIKLKPRPFLYGKMD